MKKVLVLVLALSATAVAVGLAIHLNETRPATREADRRPAATSATTTAVQLWTCGMHPQVVQDHPGNCPICHMKLVPMRTAGGGGKADGKGKVLYWWDPMLGPSSISDKPGKSAMGMDLVPVYEGEKSAGPAVVIDPAVVQNMGVRTAEVTRGPVVKSVRTVGTLEAPEPGLHDISPKVGGWIEKLYANQEGQHVHRGDPLFDLYSPDLIIAGEELVGAVKSLRALGDSVDPGLRRSAEGLVASAKRKLALLDVPDADIAAVADKLVVPRTVTFRSPSSGAVVDKAVVEGSAVQAGAKLMRIEDHSALWLDLQIYEDQMALVALGQPVDATVDAWPGRTFHGTVTFIHPHVDHMSRTTTARVTLNNPDQTLRPGMYASATIYTRPVEDAVQAPREAIIDTGERQIAFVARPGGHFEPRRVRMGIAGDDGRVQILDGLAVGETVVTSGQFLFDVESRTTEAVEKLRASSLAVTTMPLPSPVSAEPTLATTTSRASTSTAPSAITVVYCPMQKAEWLQRGETVRNPFYGTEMSDCGEARRKLAVPAKGSPLAPLIDAYLRVEEALAADRLDTDAVVALRTTAEGLSDPNYAELKKAAFAVVSAPDLKSARLALKTLSEILIRASETTHPTTTTTNLTEVRP